MKYDFLPFKIKFTKKEDVSQYSTTWGGLRGRNIKINETFSAVVDFEETDRINTKYISLFSDCPYFAGGFSRQRHNNKHKSNFVYSFFTVFFNSEDRYGKATVEKISSKKKVFSLTEEMLNNYGFVIVKENKDFEEIEL